MTEKNQEADGDSTCRVGKIAVLALDAADYQLVKDWECNNLLLDSARELETFAHSLPHPTTKEVWPTVATGAMPNQHGITDADWGWKWDNPVLRAASRLSGALPRGARDYLTERLICQGSGRDRNAPKTDESHAFNEVFQWPGISEAEHLAEAWRLGREVNAGERKINAAVERLGVNMWSEIGWLAHQSDGVVGAHTHYLDMTGHFFAKRERELRRHYEAADALVGFLRDYVDELVVLSDHGMQVSWVDEDPGEHSWRAMISATDGLQTPLPEHVKDVASWLDSHRPLDSGGHKTVSRMDTSEETLEALGYL